MREEVSFEIIVEKKYPEVKKAVEEYFNQEEWRVTEEDVRDKDKYPDSYGEKKRYAEWAEDVVYDSSLSKIYNYGKGSYMIYDDYSMLEDLPEYISEHVPDSEFKGSRDYYNSYAGPGPSESFSYKNGKLIRTVVDDDEYR